MKEERLQKAQNDKRVNYNFIVNDKIKCFSSLPDDINDMKKVVIYCHGLGSNKTWATRFYEGLINENVGLYAYDHPGHGEDTTDFSNFNLSLCINYLNGVISYVSNKHNDCDIYLFGCSFGGFVVLNKLVQNLSNVKGTILMCPAVNFCEILEQKSQISYNFFKTNQFKELYNNIKIYYDAYDEFKNGESSIKNNRFNNISIIHGSKDKTVNVDIIIDFCKTSSLDLKIIEDGSHELYGFDEEIIKFIIETIF